MSNLTPLPRFVNSEESPSSLSFIHTATHAGYPFTVCGLPVLRENFLFCFVVPEHITCPVCRAAFGGAA